MNLKAKIQKFHYEKLKFCTLSVVFFLPSVFYGCFIKIKNFLYDINFLKAKSAGIKTICIGNLTTGGVGKTPIVIELANYLTRQNKKVAIISRGYGGTLNNSKVNIIRDFESIKIDDPIFCGDEVNLISTNVISAIVLTCKNRIKSAEMAKKLGADVIITDDGFSNRKLKKDLTLLLFDSEKFTGNGKLLPLGPLREPLSEIKRADKILIINKNNKKNILNENLIKKLQYKEIHICDMEIDKIIDKNNKSLNENLKTGYAFCAIGSPEQFYSYCREKFNLAGTKSYSDHYKYSQEEIYNIINRAKKAGAEFLITTTKDYVKIRNFDYKDIPIYILKLKNKLDIEKIIENLF